MSCCQVLSLWDKNVLIAIPGVINRSNVIVVLSVLKSLGLAERKLAKRGHFLAFKGPGFVIRSRGRLSNHKFMKWRQTCIQASTNAASVRRLAIKKTAGKLVCPLETGDEKLKTKLVIILLTAADSWHWLPRLFCFLHAVQKSSPRAYRQVFLAQNFYCNHVRTIK